MAQDFPYMLVFSARQFQEKKMHSLLQQSDHSSPLNNLISYPVYEIYFRGTVEKEQISKVPFV